MKIIRRRNASTQTLGAGVHCAAEVLLKDTVFYLLPQTKQCIVWMQVFSYELTLPCRKTEFKPTCQAKLKRNLF